MPGGHPMASKGGTSLSKAYGVIDRFSEDVDITLDYRAFEEDFDPFAEEVSRTETKQFSERLTSYVSDCANHVVAPHLKNESAKLPMADQHTVEMDGEGEKIWITYPSVVEVIGEYI
jgi:predicted nucleotidyltransferase component of viral defense system